MTAPFDKSVYTPLDTFAFEAIAIAGTAVGFTAATYNPAGGNGPAKCAVVQCETAQLRYSTASTPTATAGIILNAGDTLTVWGTMDIQSILFIRTGASGQINVEYSR